MTPLELRIRDLPLPVRAAKSDWLVASHWLGFTPTGEGPNASAQCMSAVARQSNGGYVIEYITATFGEPNPGHDGDARYLADRAAHAEAAGRFVAVHRLRATSRPLVDIVGRADFEWIQDVWAKDAKRFRWSVAFPIIEKYAIPTRPRASDVLGPEAMQRLFGHPAATLRPLNDSERAAIADLPLVREESQSAWIGIEDEIAMAELSAIDKRTARAIETDLAPAAMEGLTDDQKRKVRLRAAWLAQRFVAERRKSGSLRCDDCGFDPVLRTKDTPISPRSLLDVHHRRPLEEGKRYTTVLDFALLCPTCHRFEHSAIRAGLRQPGA